MWTHEKAASSSNHDWFGRRGVARQLDSWWQLPPAPTADADRPLLGQRRSPPIAAEPGGTSDLTLLRVKPPADVLGTQVDGMFELHDGTAAKRGTRRFTPTPAQHEPSGTDTFNLAEH